MERADKFLFGMLTTYLIKCRCHFFALILDMSHEPLVGKAEHLFPRSHNKVVKQRNMHKGTKEKKCASQAFILLRWLQGAWRMVMGKDKGAGIVPQSSFYKLARIDCIYINGSFSHNLNGNNGMGIVKKYNL